MMGSDKAGYGFAFLLPFILFFCLPAAALANGMPYWQDPGTATGNIMPVHENRVGILHEELNLEVAAEKKRLGINPNVAISVNVIYEMMNPSSAPADIAVAFPQTGFMADWTVMLDGHPVPLEGEKELEWARVGETAGPRKWVDPRTGEEYELKRLYPSYHPYHEELKAQTFTLHLAPGAHRLEVAYSVRPGEDETRWLNPVYSFDYFLLPASYWQEFGTLRITLEIPFPHYLYSSLPLKRVNGQRWEGSFDRLPQENLHLYFSSREGAWGGLVTTRQGALLVLAVIVLLYALFRRRVLRGRPLRYSAALDLVSASLVAWAGYATFGRKLFGYPFNGFQDLLFWGLLAWLYGPLCKRLWGKIRKKWSEVMYS